MLDLNGGPRVISCKHKAHAYVTLSMRRIILLTFRPPPCTYNTHIGRWVDIHKHIEIYSPYIISQRIVRRRGKRPPQAHLRSWDRYAFRAVESSGRTPNVVSELLNDRHYRVISDAINHRREIYIQHSYMACWKASSNYAHVQLTPSTTHN